MHITKLTDYADRIDILSQLREIFFLTSTKKDFSSSIEKEKFFQKWVGHYISHLPDWTYLSFAEKTPRLQLLGYLTGCPDSLAASPNLNLASLDLFHDQFSNYPAHFHIDLHPHSQGKGIGSALIDAFIQDLERKNVCGVHIITAADAENVKFYAKFGFDYRVERTLNDATLMLMGRRLNV